MNNHIQIIYKKYRPVDKNHKKFEKTINNGLNIAFFLLFFHHAPVFRSNKRFPVVSAGQGAILIGVLRHLDLITVFWA